MKENLRIALKAAVAAGNEIMRIYEGEELDIKSKEDSSPLTIADTKANEIINKFLIPIGIPIISEENRQVDYNVRAKWTQCWIVDPLDGTKEFIKRNGEFTVNISLISLGTPVLGVIYAPALKTIYFANVSAGKAFKSSVNTEDSNIEDIFNNAREIYPAGSRNYIKVVGSRSHMNDETLNYIEKLKKKYGKDVEVVSKGSSLKFCLVAEGEAHVYPRFGPTMEWDTAAGQAICEAVGLNCILMDTGKAMTYNRANLLNGHFLVSNEG